METAPQKMQQKMVRNGFVILVLVLAFAGLLWNTYEFGQPGPDPKLYQVVLLRNDQAFYGKLHNIHGDYPYLTDVYYLKPQSEQAKFTVVKRGIDELHQPTDSLFFSRENILYWENVGPDSLVAKGIRADRGYRANQALNQQIGQNRAPAAMQNAQPAAMQNPSQSPAKDAKKK